MTMQHIWKATTALFALTTITLAVLVMQPEEPVREYVYEDNSKHTSAYAGEEERGIKSLSQVDVESLQEGSGVAFGGMAKLAELNGYPGPRHVLDAVEELNLTEEQKEKTQDLFDAMQNDAISIGEEIINIEQRMDDGFSSSTIDKTSLQEDIEASAELYAELRYTHLATHFDMVDILTEEQVAEYNLLRGYTDNSDPCDAVPDGHDAELWNLHNNCN